MHEIEKRLGVFGVGDNVKDTIILNEKPYVPWPLKMENFCEAYGYYWFTSLYYNALFKVNKENWVAEYVCSFPNEDSVERMYSKIVVCKTKLYCIPLAANSIGVYDILSGESYSIQIAPPQNVNRSVLYRKESKFIDAVCEEDFLYLFPHTYPAILRLRFSDEQIDYLYDELSTRDGKKRNALFYFSRVVRLNNQIWLYANYTGELFQFNSKLLYMEKFNGFKIPGTAVIAGKGDYLWVFSVSDCIIYKVDLLHQKSFILQNMPSKFTPGSFAITRGSIYGDYVYFVPGTANMPLKVNIKTDEITLADEIAPYKTESGEAHELWKFWLLETLDDKLFAYDATCSKLIQYDFHNENIRREFIKSKSTDVQARDWNERYYVGTKRLMNKINDLNSFLHLFKN